MSKHKIGIYVDNNLIVWGFNNFKETRVFIKTRLSEFIKDDIKDHKVKARYFK